jgi:DsbC/DsbD-like thiol-disulfide interchange protein
MHKGLFRSLFIVTFAVISFAIAASGQNITGSITGGAVTKGSSARGVVSILIPAGLHVNSNKPSSQYAIPTTVKLSGTGVKIGGISYPRGANRKFEFTENPINVYEGTVRIPFSVTVPASFSGDVVRLRATVKYQACTNEVCYPPKSKEITITAKVH